MRKPKCYSCGKTASWSIMFCSKKCAAHIALELFEGSWDWFWCSDCTDWVNDDPYTDYHSSASANSGECYGETISLDEYRREREIRRGGSK